MGLILYTPEVGGPLFRVSPVQVSHLSLRKYGITGARPKTIPNTTTDGTFFFSPVYPETRTGEEGLLFVGAHLSAKRKPTTYFVSFEFQISAPMRRTSRVTFEIFSADLNEVTKITPESEIAYFLVR